MDRSSIIGIVIDTDLFHPWRLKIQFFRFRPLTSMDNFESPPNGPVDRYAQFYCEARIGKRLTRPPVRILSIFNVLRPGGPAVVRQWGAHGLEYRHIAIEAIDVIEKQAMQMDIEIIPGCPRPSKSLPAFCQRPNQNAR